ncbi:MAG: N-acetyltransferase [Desulfobacterales bacterium]|nr:N-acetyltransferase [Desulfobacterales bacterium]
MLIRDARMGDVKNIYNLLQHFAAQDLLLGRSLSVLYDQLRDFKVAVVNEDKGSGEERLAGICALHISWEDLAEIRSLAIGEEFQGAGIGRQLVEVCWQEALDFGINRVFTLTYQPDFFRKLGFKDIDKGELPHKVWSDCVQCSKFPDCNEEALIRVHPAAAGQAG